jgi:hypothetical protein
MCQIELCCGNEVLFGRVFNIHPVTCPDIVFHLPYQNCSMQHRDASLGFGNWELRLGPSYHTWAVRMSIHSSIEN